MKRRLNKSTMLYDNSTAKTYSDIAWFYSQLNYYFWMDPFGTSMLEDLSDPANFSRKEFALNMQESGAYPQGSFLLAETLPLSS